MPGLAPACPLAITHPFGLRYRRLFVCFGAEVVWVPEPGLAPAGEALFFASPKKSTQKKGDPGCCVPCASLRGNLRCSVQAGSRQLASLKQVFALIRLALRSSAHPQG